MKENEILINKLREKELKKSKEKFDNTIEKFNKSYGRMKKYTISNEPKALDILIDYTIYPDINIYSVPSKCFYGEKLQSDEFILSNEFEKQKLREIKLNTAISISLEAERCLKNIYVHM